MISPRRAPRPRNAWLARNFFEIVLLAILVIACSDEITPPVEDLCDTVALPVTGAPAGPTITDVAIEAQTGDGVVVLATATDPQGGDNLRDVLQTIGVFPDDRCEGDPILLQDDLVDSGVEESFGIAASASSALFAEIAASTSWPVSVDFSDLDGNRVTAHVNARIIPVDQGVVATVAE